MQHRTNQIVQSDSFILLLFVTQGSNNSDRDLFYLLHVIV